MVMADIRLEYGVYTMAQPSRDPSSHISVGDPPGQRLPGVVHCQYGLA